MVTKAAERTGLDLSFLLSHAAHVLTTRMTAAFAEIDLTPRGYRVLVHAMSGEFTQIELARLSDLDKTTMVVTLDELERAGYAERHHSGTDRRARIITVTDAGRRVVEVGHRIADRVHGEVLAALPPRQRAGFLQSLTHLVNGLLAEPVVSDHPVRRARQSPRQI